MYSKTIIFLMLCTLLVACKNIEGFNNPIVTALRFSYGIGGK